jgi:CHAT domain-containing protein
VGAAKEDNADLPAEKCDMSETLMPYPNIDLDDISWLGFADLQSVLQLESSWDTQKGIIEEWITRAIKNRVSEIIADHTIDQLWRDLVEISCTLLNSTNIQGFHIQPQQLIFSWYALEIPWEDLSDFHLQRAFDAYSLILEITRHRKAQIFHVAVFSILTKKFTWLTKSERHISVILAASQNYLPAMVDIAMGCVDNLEHEPILSSKKDITIEWLSSFIAVEYILQVHNSPFPTYLLDFQRSLHKLLQKMGSHILVTVSDQLSPNFVTVRSLIRAAESAYDQVGANNNIKVDLEGRDEPICNGIVAQAIKQPQSFASWIMMRSKISIVRKVSTADDISRQTDNDLRWKYFTFSSRYFFERHKNENISEIIENLGGVIDIVDPTDAIPSPETTDTYEPKLTLKSCFEAIHEGVCSSYPLREGLPDFADLFFQPDKIHHLLAPFAEQASNPILDQFSARGAYFWDHLSRSGGFCGLDAPETALAEQSKLISGLKELAAEERAKIYEFFSWNRFDLPAAIYNNTAWAFFNLGDYTKAYYWYFIWMWKQQHFSYLIFERIRKSQRIAPTNISDDGKGNLAQEPLPYELSRLTRGTHLNTIGYLKSRSSHLQYLKEKGTYSGFISALTSGELNIAEYLGTIETKEAQIEIISELNGFYNIGMEFLIHHKMFSEALLFWENRKAKHVLASVSLNSAGKALGQDSPFLPSAGQFRIAFLGDEHQNIFNQAIDQMSMDEIILSFFTLHDSIGCFRLKKNGQISVFTDLISNKDLHQYSASIAELFDGYGAFRAAPKTVRDLRDSKISSLLIKLYDSLFRPLLLEKMKLVTVIPTGDMFNIPIPALLTSEDGKFFGDLHRVTIKMNLVRRTFNQNSESPPIVYGVFSPDERLPNIKSEYNSLVSLLNERLILQDTPPASNPASRYQTAGSILHIAGHAHFDRENPYNSGITLPTGKYLTSHEIIKNSLKYDTVVLNACNTGRALIHDADISIGLSASFLFNGTRHCVSTLWQIEDGVASEFVINLYSELLKNGFSFRKAFQDTLNLIRKNSLYTHPYFWAGWRLMENQ